MGYTADVLDLRSLKKSISTSKSVNAREYSRKKVVHLKHFLWGAGVGGGWGVVPENCALNFNVTKKRHSHFPIVSLTSDY